jgi:hypothetical protein
VPRITFRERKYEEAGQEYITKILVISNLKKILSGWSNQEA